MSEFKKQFLEDELLEAYRRKRAVDGGSVPTDRIWDAAEHYKWSNEVARLEEAIKIEEKS